MSKKVPELRFKGFHDVWENRKLGEVFEQTSEYINPQEEDIELYSLTIEKGLTQKTEKYDRSFLVKKEDKFKKVNPNDFVYNPMNITLGAVGFNETGYSVAVSGYYITMKINSNFNNQYFKIWLSSPQAIYSYRKYATGSLKEKQRVQFPTFSQIKIKVPSFEEQQKIGALFKQLDDTISLQQKLVEQYQQYKKAMLQKMFPQKGERVPKLRFKGFNDEWKRYQLGDISDKVTEKNKGNVYSETFTNSAEHGIISQRDFFEKDISNKNNLDGYYIVRPGDFVYNPRISNLAPVGPIKRNNLGRTGVMSPLYYVFRVHDVVNKDFLEAYFSSTGWHKFMKLNGDTGARSDRFAIKDSVFRQMPIPLPSTEEQQKIGIFFKQLDDTIALHQKKLENYKQLKKALLQRMFV
ncbi:restriction endonuclease subunit S [Bacillus sp. FSL W8-1127]|uniref:restriction endonuclease subunit S n=1 Tax=Bacillus sp. FSL W8-1127 TaxID=2954710 RepID=UPI0030F6D2D8